MTLAYNDRHRFSQAGFRQQLDALQIFDVHRSINSESEFREKRSYVVGREGHIYIGDSSVSKEHAEITMAGGRIHLRDLKSTNGLYLVINRKAVRFREGYVLPDQRIALGAQQYTIRQLLAIIGVSVD